MAHVDAYVPSAKQVFSPLLLRAPSSLQDELENANFDSSSREDQDLSDKLPKVIQI